MAVVSPLPAQVLRALVQADVTEGSRLCCALSGGVDSRVLLHILTGLRARLSFRLTAVHVHHGLSPHADAWAAFCRELCAAAGVPLTVHRVDVARDDPAGLEAAARRARHRVLLASECDWLVFGHHADDQAETVLFRLLRGAGVRGAAGMAEREAPAGQQPGRLRPLLDSRRAEIEAYAREHGLQWVEDESNEDRRYTRNDLRHRLLPAMEEGFPGAARTLARAAANFREASALLDELAAMDEAACGGQPLERAQLLRLSEARCANLLRWQAGRLGAEMPARARLLEVIRQLHGVEAARGFRVALGALDCCCYRGKVWLEPAASLAGAAARAWAGEAEVPWLGGVLRFSSARGEGLSAARLQAAHALRLLPRWPGMRLRLVAGRPSRSFKNLCQEAGIPAWQRERLPVLQVDGCAAWVGGIGTAAEFAAAADEDAVAVEWLPLVPPAGEP